MAGLIPTDPITLTDALSGSNVIPGDILKLRAGTYTLDSINQIIGSSGSPVIVKAYEGERVILCGDFTDAAAQYVTYVDLEFSAVRDPNPSEYSSPWHNFQGARIKVINCILHDSNGAAAWDDVDLIYGCISYNHGAIVNGTTAYGHSLYTQNSDAGHKKTVKHSIFGRSANYGYHLYATAFPVVNVDIIENVLLPGSIHLIGSIRADDSITFDGNHSVGIVIFGYGSYDHTNMVVTNNIAYGNNFSPFGIKRLVSGNVSGNKFIGLGTINYILDYTHPADSPTLTMNNNSYYTHSGVAIVNEDGVASYSTLANWQAAHGYDANSTAYQDSTLPADSVTVYPNDYASISKRKGLVVIWNWTQAGSVSVELTSLGIAEGTSCKLLQAQDPLGDQRSFTMPANKTISVTMSGTIASVSGWADPPTTFPTFGTFIVEAV